MDRETVRSIILATGITLAGLLAGAGLARARANDRYVTVKGVAEREVKADLAIWPLRVVAASEELGAAQASLESGMAKIRAFLVRQGIDTTSASVQDFVVSDASTEGGYQQGSRARFVIRQTMVVRSTRPEQVLAASQRVGELVSAGVVLSSGGDYGSGGPTFVFTGLNGLKPKMIADATARAREAAEQFAHDSRTSLGGIRTANQGVFEILPRDPAPGMQQEGQINKTVRVVSTVEYFLK